MTIHLGFFCNDFIALATITHSLKKKVVEYLLPNTDPIPQGYHGMRKHVLGQILFHMYNECCFSGKLGVSVWKENIVCGEEGASLRGECHF